LPTTFTEVIEERAGKDESGAPCIYKIARKVRQRNARPLTDTERSDKADVIRKEVRAKWQASRMRETIAKKTEARISSTLNVGIKKGGVK
jgi:hypothetical protein